MHVNIRGGRRVISPKGIDYKDRLIGVCYDYEKGAKFRGTLGKEFVEVLKPDNEQRIYRVDATEKDDFKSWLEKLTNNSGVYDDEKIVVTGEFPSYSLKVG